jgi:NAD(P)-dependent dehydrogenase (short-subunit alcohol dehydrogenase family)
MLCFRPGGAFAPTIPTALRGKVVANSEPSHDADPTARMHSPQSGLVHFRVDTCASKGAVLSLTRALALEYAQDNIRINALCPGPIDTPMLQQEFDRSDFPKQAKLAGVATMPIGRLGHPAEVAQVALFLASDAPALLQGATLIVDGAKIIL